MNIKKIVFVGVFLISATLVATQIYAAQTFVDLQSFYRSTLTTSISSTATTISVATAPNVDTAFLVIEPRTQNQEIVLMTGRTGTNLTVVRGLAVYGATTTGSTGTQRSHSAGAGIELTDVHYYIKTLQNDPAFTYRGATTTTGFATIVNPTTGDTAFNLTESTFYYYDGVSWEPAVAPVTAGNASTGSAGIVEIATQLETASSTPTGGTGAIVVIPASNATSTYNAATAPLRVVVTRNDGKIDAGFVASSTQFSVTATTTLSATSSVSIGAFPAWQIGMQRNIITTLGTSTFAIPSGITKLFVEVYGGGGNGDPCTGSGSGCVSPGGGAGGYANEVVDVTGTTTVQVYVGSGGASGASNTNGQWSTFGTNGFYLYATGGTSDNNPGGRGGCGFDADINGCGSNGYPALSDSDASIPGAGGSSALGAGGQPTLSNGTGDAGRGFASGGGGCQTNASNSCQGGAGSQGIIIIRW